MKAEEIPVISHSSPGIPRIIKEHFDPDHLLSRIEIQQSYNKLEYDRSLKPQTRELIKEHMEKVEQDGFTSIREVGEEEWNRFNSRKAGEEEGNG
ncbi:hypothetical protein [Algoriphagus resistens]|uniref:hypothetical protein n=1 Tax=Algoriphagus resistens TaxID=1750590 RepID=UPI00071690FF|nr:hypothetical protein [Algoriphagus resistens]